jgi:hypothetical protein
MPLYSSIMLLSLEYQLLLRLEVPLNQATVFRRSKHAPIVCAPLECCYRLLVSLQKSFFEIFIFTLIIMISYVVIKLSFLFENLIFKSPSKYVVLFLIEYFDLCLSLDPL